MNRGEIWRVAFDPALGEEIRKTRPAIIISSNAVGILNLRVVVPLTEWRAEFAVYPWMVRIEPSRSNRLTKNSAADAFQAKSLSTVRLLQPLGSVSSEELLAIVLAVGRVIEHP